MVLKATARPNELSLGAVRAQAGVILCSGSSCMAPASGPTTARGECDNAGAMYDETKHRITLAWARTAPRLNSLGRADTFRTILLTSFSHQGHSRRTCDAAVGVLVYGRRRQERRGQVAPIGRVRRPARGRGTMARGSAGVGPRDARSKKRAEKPWHFASNARVFALMKYLPTS